MKISFSLLFLVLVFVAIAVESAVVFDNSAGVAVDSCALQHMTKTECDTCVNDPSEVSAANTRCAYQRQGSCKNDAEFAANQVGDYWLVCVNKQRIDNDPAKSLYSARWVAKTDVWRLFPPFVSNDYNHFAGWQNPDVNCTCNLPYLVSPTSVVGGEQSVIGSPTSWQAYSYCGTNNVFVHVGVRNSAAASKVAATDGWIVRDKYNPSTSTTRDNVILRALRTNNAVTFTNPSGWETYTLNSLYQGTPGLPPLTFPPGPGAFYYGWMAYLQEADKYFYVWYIDGVMVCLDHLQGCRGMVDIPGTSVEARTHGWLASVERNTLSSSCPKMDARAKPGGGGGGTTCSVKQLKYTWRRACSGAPKGVTAVAPVRLPAPCQKGIGVTVSCLLNGANGIGGCQEFTQYLAATHAVTFDVDAKKQCEDEMSAAIQHLSETDVSSSPVRPGFLALAASDKCIGWRGPMYKCVDCPTAYERCTSCPNPSTDHGCWKDPAQSCACVKCPAELTCYGKTFWDKKTCTCKPCVRPTCPACTTTQCSYPNLIDACDTTCKTCTRKTCGAEGHKTPASIYYPSECMECRDCEDNTAAKQSCEYNAQGVRVGYYLYNANDKTCRCLTCGPPLNDAWWNGKTKPAAGDLYTPTCRAGPYADNIAKPSFSNSASQIGNTYYDPNVNRCECQNCRALWSDTSIMGESTRLEDGSCAKDGFKASESNECALCYKCAECPDGWQAPKITRK